MTQSTCTYYQGGLREDAKTSVLPATVWHMEELGRALLSGLAAAVVTCRGLDLGMSGELLYRAQIGAGIQEIADEGPPQVVRCEGRHTRLESSLAGDVQHALPRHPPPPQLPALIDGHKQRPRPDPADREP